MLPTHARLAVAGGATTNATCQLLPLSTTPSDRPTTRIAPAPSRVTRSHVIFAINSKGEPTTHVGFA